jgi:hypothetical protein
MWHIGGGGRPGHAGVLCVELEELNRLEDLGVDGRMILQMDQRVLG